MLHERTRGLLRGAVRTSRRQQNNAYGDLLKRMLF